MVTDQHLQTIVFYILSVFSSLCQEGKPYPDSPIWTERIIALFFSENLYVERLPIWLTKKKLFSFFCVFFIYTRFSPNCQG